MEWSMEWNEWKEWNGMEWNGMEWTEWNGNGMEMEMEWNGTMEGNNDLANPGFDLIK